MKKYTLLWVLALISGALQAQPLVTIQQIQTAAAANLSNCIDSNGYVGDTVKVRGVVVMDAKTLDANGNQVNNAQAASGRNIWIQNGTGPYSGIDVYKASNGGTATTPDDILDLIAGDSVEIVGIVYNYGSNNFSALGESELMPLTVTLLGSGQNGVQVNPVNLADINDANRVNILPTGEQWEGAYIELTNVTVAAVSYFSNNARVSFDVVDAAGNKMNISDRFMAGRMANNSTPGIFVPPAVGDKFDTLRGVLVHSQNGCPGANGRGYELFPFRNEDYVRTLGYSAPQISAFTRTPVTPTSSQAATISVKVVDVDGVVDNVTLRYAVGQNTSTYQNVPMAKGVADTTIYTADIPMQADGSFVKYYVAAVDTQGLTSYQPSVPSNSGNPKFYFVRDNGTQIYDVQYTPYSDGNSGYMGLDVTVEGVVTGSSADLGYIYIQQENQLGWGGLSLTGNASLATVAPGDKIRVTGTMEEYFSLTQMGNISNVSKIGSGTISPLAVHPDSLQTYKFSRNEAYEGMLVTLAGATAGKKVYVVDKNADSGNFGEYRVGRDPFSANGCRVLAGRQTSSTFSSLNVAYVNDSSWAATDGVMNVPACVVNYGDSLTSITGILTYSFSNLKLLPRTNADVVGFAGANSPTGDFTATPTALMADFAATGNGDTYTWNFGDGNTGTGATASHTYTAAGTYTVSLVMENGCGTTTITKEVTVITSVDAAAALGFSVAPNPAADVVAVRLSKVNDTATVAITDLSGAVVATRTFEAANGTDLNVANLAAGAYLVQVRTAQGTATHKLLIAR